MFSRWCAVIAGVVMTSVTTGWAHHSIAAVYDGSKTVTISGVVEAFYFVNPHPWVLVTVATEGTSDSWRLEMDNRNELASVGMTADTLAPGDQATVTGSPSREQPHSLYVRRLDRSADGFRYEQVGTSPRIHRSGAD